MLIINLFIIFLVINYHILYDLEKQNIIEITRNDDNISNDVKLKNKRKAYKYPEMDVIFIETNPKDDKINEKCFF